MREFPDAFSTVGLIEDIIGLGKTCTSARVIPWHLAQVEAINLAVGPGPTSHMADDCNWFQMQRLLSINKTEFGGASKLVRVKVEETDAKANDGWMPEKVGRGRARIAKASIDRVPVA